MTKVWRDLPDPVLNESAWERQMNIAGFEAYEDNRRKDAADTSAGQKLIRRSLKAVQAGIEAKQKALFESNTNRNHKGTLMVVPADTMALITLRVLLNRTYSAADPTTGATLQNIAVDVAKAVELEANFRHWVTQSKETAKAWAEANGRKSAKSMAERLLEDKSMKLNYRRKWSKVFGELAAYEWDIVEKHFAGTALIGVVLETCPHMFEVKMVPRGVKTTRYIRMTDSFRHMFEEIEGQIARTQVVKKPMLTRPRPWVRATVEQSED